MPLTYNLEIFGSSFNWGEIISKKFSINVQQTWMSKEGESHTFCMATEAPHFLPDHIPDQLILGEICYQTILQGYNATLVKDKKRAFIPYRFHVGFYIVKNTAQDKQEGLSQLEFKFPIDWFC
jgi:hypothetical protein